MSKAVVKSKSRLRDLGLTKGHANLVYEGEIRTHPRGSIYSGNGDAEELVQEDPSGVREIMKHARGWFERSLFLKQGLKLKIGFANCGFEIKPAKGTAKGSSQKIRKWWAGLGTRAQKDIYELGLESWLDWYLLDVTIAFWRDNFQSARIDKHQPVFTLPPEDCRYTDIFGVEVLKVLMNLGSDEKKDLSNAMVERYGRREVTLDEAKGENFRVLKRARRGKGFGCPHIYTLIKTLKATDGLETMDVLWAHKCRTAMRQFLVGHEIKNGPWAGRASHFWTEKIGQAIQKFWEAKMGDVDWSTNFDVKVEFPFPSLDRFKKEKFEGVFQRMALWLGPVGAIFFGAKVDDMQMKALRAELLEDRALMRFHLIDILTTVYDPPVAIDIKWSEKIFIDSRLYLELLKQLLTAGPLSQRTALEALAEDAETQREYKEEEAELAQSEKTKGQVLPMYDPAHGNEPGKAGPAGAPGRPAGKTSKPEA